MQHVFVHPGGQDDNLGDSALRVGLLRALDLDGVQLHVLLEDQSSDYVAGLPIAHRYRPYSTRHEWLQASNKVRGPVYVVNAGEINPIPGATYPPQRRTAELREVLASGGAVIAAGIGLKNPAVAPRVAFDVALRNATVISWRDSGSRDAAGFGDVAPDWAFALGPDVSEWSPTDARSQITVTLRFDKPWPGQEWLDSVRLLAASTNTGIVTIAQVARDAPRAVRLADALGGEYLCAPSTRHNDLNAHVRAAYSRSLAVVSDRAHALIIGATEGAYPIGSADDPQKIRRLLDTAAMGELTGSHEGFAERSGGLASVLPNLAPAVIASRRSLTDLAERIREAVRG